MTPFHRFVLRFLPRPLAVLVVASVYGAALFMIVGLLGYDSSAQIVYLAVGAK